MNYSILFEKQWEIINVKHNKIVRALQKYIMSMFSPRFLFIFPTTSYSCWHRHCFLFVCLSCLLFFIYHSYETHEYLGCLQFCAFASTDSHFSLKNPFHSHLPKASRMRRRRKKNLQFSISILTFLYRVSFKQPYILNEGMVYKKKKFWWWWK